jgi:hypothetical protein
MKLNKTTEWTLIAALAAYIAFMPRIGVVRDFLSSGVGRLAALLLIVYTWKYVNALVAVLLVVAFVRCTTSVWEGLEGGTPSTDPVEVQGKAKKEGTKCPEETEFDVPTQMCKGNDGVSMVLPIMVACAAGYKPNSEGTRCVKMTSPPAPPPPSPANEQPDTPPASSTGSTMANNAAPPATTEPFEGGTGVPATTPGEAQTQAQSGAPVVLRRQGGVEPFSLLGGAFPLQ